MLRSKSAFIEEQADLIIARLVESKLVPEDGESQTLAYNIVRQVLEG